MEPLSTHTTRYTHNAGVSDYGTTTADNGLAGTIDENNPHYQKLREATHEVERLKSLVPPVPDRTLQTALNKQEWARAQANKNGVFGVNGTETTPTSSTNPPPPQSPSRGILDHWKTLYDRGYQGNEKDIGAMARWEKFEKAFLVFMKVVNTSTTAWKKDSTNIDQSGVVVDFGSLINAINELSAQFGGDDGKLITFTGPDAEKDATDWAEKNFGTSKDNIVKNPDGSYSVIIDLKPLEVMLDVMIDLDGKQTANGGYLITQQNTALTNAFDTFKKNTDTQGDKASRMVVMSKEAFDSFCKRIMDWLKSFEEAIAKANA